MDENYRYALKLLKKRDYTVPKLSEKLQSECGETPPEVIQQLLQKNFLNDRRFAENHVRRKKHCGPLQLREELSARGVPSQIAEEILSGLEWPSLHEALKAKMDDW